MSRGAFRGAAGAWLGLIALQTLTTGQSSSKVGGAFDWVASVFSRALDPKVPAIPDHSTSHTEDANKPSPALGGATPAQVANGAAVAGVLDPPKLAQALGTVTSPDFSSLAGLGGLANYTPEQLAAAWGLQP